MPDFAADDFSTIAQRLKEIREEKERARVQQEPSAPAEKAEDLSYGYAGY